ncbi:MAG TPA: MFS transporter, partial [Sphingomicrobium sp.]
MSGAAEQRGRASTLVLLLLLLAYIFNFLDRTILSILGGPIIAELKLSDWQFGVLSGPPFAILYSVLAIPFAYFADRTSRGRVIAAAVAVWSVFTALCGAAASFWQLFVFRMGVGIGEAGGVAPSYAL